MIDRPVVLITGGGSGIGEATARRLHRDDWDVAVTGRRPALIGQVANEISGLAIVGDTANPDDASEAITAVIERFGRLDALVLNAGQGGVGSLQDFDHERFESVMHTNVTGAAIMSSAALPHLIESRGSIVSVASIAGLRAAPESLAYCASKAAMIMLTNCIALDHGPDGVRANSVCPGWTRTPMADAEMDSAAALLSDSGEAVGGGTVIDREGAYRAATSLVPLRRAASPAEVAGTIAWLVSSDASYVTGAVINVDGGSIQVDVATTIFSTNP